MTQPVWDDGRLDAAFHEKFGRPAPFDLEREVRARIDGTSPLRFPAIRRNGAGRALAAAAVVAVLVGTLTVGLGGFGRTAGSASPSPSASAATATPSATQGTSATPTAQAIPGSVFGLPIIHVPDAIAIRDSGVDDREFAVAGWFTPAPPASCAGDAGKVVVSPVQLRCPDQSIWLTEDAGSYVHVAGDRLVTETPQFTAALNPDLDGLDSSWWPPLPAPAPGQDGGSTPVDVVFVGHFDDRRAALCPAAEQAACRDRFVVDSVALVRGGTTKADRVSPTNVTTRSTSSDVEAIVANEAPQSQILSMTIVDANELRTIEPTLGTGQAQLADPYTVWIVRVLESERISTYLVIDGSDAIYEMNPDNAHILVGGTPPDAQSSASPTSWPPAGATVVDLSNGIGKPPAHVAVVDMSGRLTSVTVPTDTNVVSGVDGFGASGDPGKPGRVNLSWIGGECDSQVTATVAADLQSISFDMGPRPDCDSIGVGHQLVLDFSGSVDVGAIQVGEIPAAPSPSPLDGLGYSLDCGSLAPDTCDAQAARVIAATPSQRIVSIVFSDECGSYLVTFDNGDATRADIDCIPGASPN